MRRSAFIIYTNLLLWLLLLLRLRSLLLLLSLEKEARYEIQYFLQCNLPFSIAILISSFNVFRTRPRSRTFLVFFFMFSTHFHNISQYILPLSQFSIWRKLLPSFTIQALFVPSFLTNENEACASFLFLKNGSRERVTNRIYFWKQNRKAWLINSK